MISQRLSKRSVMPAPVSVDTRPGSIGWTIRSREQWWTICTTQCQTSVCWFCPQHCSQAEIDGANAAKKKRSSLRLSVWLFCTGWKMSEEERQYIQWFIYWIPSLHLFVFQGQTVRKQRCLGHVLGKSFKAKSHTKLQRCFGCGS